MSLDVYAHIGLFSEFMVSTSRAKAIFMFGYTKEAGFTARLSTLAASRNSCAANASGGQFSITSPKPSITIPIRPRSDWISRDEPEPILSWSAPDLYS